MASLYNIFLRRDQVSVVEASLRKSALTDNEAEDPQKVIASGLVAQALSSGDMNSVRDALRSKNLEAPIQKCFQRMQIIQHNVRGSEAENENLLPEFIALRVWSGVRRCSSL